jgi:hypothetical protein
MNTADDTEIRRLVTAAMGTGLMRCPVTIEAAAAFITTGEGFNPRNPCPDCHELDDLVDDLLWYWRAEIFGQNFDYALEKLSELFPSQDPDAKD